jgi:hypothetical protein
MRRYTIATAVAALILLAGCSSSATTSHAPNPAAPPAQKSTQTTGQVYKIGDSFALPGNGGDTTFQLTVDGVSNTVDPVVTKELQSLFSLDTNPDPGMKWVIVEIHGTNTGNQPGAFNTQFFVLTAGGKQFNVRLAQKDSYISQTYSELKHSNLSASNNPGETGYGWVVFQVPSGLPVQSILVSTEGLDLSGQLSGPSATVDLTGH